MWMWQVVDAKRHFEQKRKVTDDAWCKREALTRHADRPPHQLSHEGQSFVTVIFLPKLAHHRAELPIAWIAITLLAAAAGAAMRGRRRPGYAHGLVEGAARSAEGGGSHLRSVK